MSFFIAIAIGNRSAEEYLFFKIKKRVRHTLRFYWFGHQRYWADTSMLPQ